MQTVRVVKNVKKDFYLPIETVEEATEISSQIGLTLSEFVRRALAEFVESQKRALINIELKDACIRNRDEERKLAEEWRITETKVE